VEIIYKRSLFAFLDSRVTFFVSDKANDPEKVKACGRHIQGQSEADWESLGRVSAHRADTINLFLSKEPTKEKGEFIQ